MTNHKTFIVRHLDKEAKKAKTEIDGRQMFKDWDVTITITHEYSYKIRLWLATRLILFASSILRCPIHIEAKQVDDEKTSD